MNDNESLEDVIASFRQTESSFQKQLDGMDLKMIDASQEKRINKIVSILADIKAGIGEIENSYIPLRVVGRITSQFLKKRISMFTKAVNIDPQEYLESTADDKAKGKGAIVSLSKVRNDFVEDLGIIRLECTSKRRALIEGKRLLSIDGGGVRGVCSLLVLKALMIAVQAVKDGQDELEFPDHWEDFKKLIVNEDPRDHFDLVGGTSTGGLIAIMIFRLGLSIHDVEEYYDAMSKVIFAPRRSSYIGGNIARPLFNRPWYSGSKLKGQIEKVVNKAGEPPDAMMMNGVDNRTRVFVCAVIKHGHQTINFRTWRPSKPPLFDDIGCSIVDAAQATSAAPLYFPSHKIDHIKYWDGGLQNNNPICQVCCENESDRPSIVLSLGTGVPEPVAKMSRYSPSSDAPDPGGDLQKLMNPRTVAGRRSRLSLPLISKVQAMFKFVTDAEAKHRDFERLLSSWSVHYRRFNPHLNQNVTFTDYSQIPNLITQTKAYLQTPMQKEELMVAARLLLHQPEELDPLGCC